MKSCSKLIRFGLTVMTLSWSLLAKESDRSKERAGVETHSIKVGESHRPTNNELRFLGVRGATQRLESSFRQQISTQTENAEALADSIFAEMDDTEKREFSPEVSALDKEAMTRRVGLVDQALGRLGLRNEKNMRTAAPMDTLWFTAPGGELSQERKILDAEGNHRGTIVITNSGISVVDPSSQSLLRSIHIENASMKAGVQIMAEGIPKEAEYEMLKAIKYELYALFPHRKFEIDETVGLRQGKLLDLIIQQAR